jgi:hypothetical protein
MATLCLQPKVQTCREGETQRHGSDEQSESLTLVAPVANVDE